MITEKDKTKALQRMIKPIDKAGAYRTGSLDDDITPQEIAKILGFKANVADDPDKVKYSWGFKFMGMECGIWDYKGCRWSTFGPKKAFVALFGKERVGS